MDYGKRDQWSADVPGGLKAGLRGAIVLLNERSADAIFFTGASEIPGGTPMARHRNDRGRGLSEIGRERIGLGAGLEA